MGLVTTVTFGFVYDAVVDRVFFAFGGGEVLSLLKDEVGSDADDFFNFFYFFDVVKG